MVILAMVPTQRELDSLTTSMKGYTGYVQLGRASVQEYFDALKLKCGQYRIKYVQADINEGFNKILTTYLVERQKFG